MKNLRVIRRPLGELLHISFELERSRMMLLLGTMVIAGALPALSAVLLGAMIDGFARGSDILVLAVAFAVSTAAAPLMQSLMNLLGFDMGDRITQRMEQQIMRASSSHTGIQHLEDPGYADKLKLIRDHRHLPATALIHLSSMSYMVVGTVAGTIVLAGIFPPLSLFLPALLPGLLLHVAAQRRAVAGFDERALEERLADYYLSLTVEKASVMEERMLGFGDRLLTLHRTLAGSFISAYIKERFRRLRSGLVTGLLLGGCTATALGWLGYLSVDGRITLGEFAAGTQVVILALARSMMGAEVLARVAELAFVMERYRWLLDYDPGAIGGSLMPDGAAAGVEFKGVSFTYPGASAPALQELSLTIKPGQRLAIVGENGAGKTTIIKLLLRFYEPQEGRILVNGVDLRDIDPERWRAELTAVFQDFVRYQFIVREAIGLGDLTQSADDDAVLSAAAAGGSKKIIQDLPHGLDTQLGREFTGGVELSEGSWQRVALSRAFMKQAPLIFLMDEPTARVDAHAEAQVYQRFIESSGVAHPATIILVSHRLSSVRHADAIAVLADGRVAEIGTHEELIQRGATYATLFRLQASRYTS